MVPDPDLDLVAALRRVVRSEIPGARSAEWSQVATGHAGRVYTGAGLRHPLPPEAVQIFGQLREQMRGEEQGVWFSARLDLGEGEEAAVFTPNFTDRVYWNSPDLLTPPEDAAPVPGDEDWQAELRRNPRTPPFVPSWIEAPAPATEEFIHLRRAIDRLGLPLGAVRLPGEEHVTFEGALLVRQLESTFSVDVFDYGQLLHIATRDDERAAGMVAWNYLSSPLPHPATLHAADLERRVLSAREGYTALAARVRSAGPGGVVTNLPAGVPFDRWGTFDGLYLFAWDTPLPQRSLPPSAISDGARRIGFLTNRPIPVQAEFTPAWFDQPGGGIRFRTRDSLRNLIRSADLSILRAGHH